MNELEKCPFCYYSDGYVISYGKEYKVVCVECGQCGCKGPVVPICEFSDFYTVEEAIKKCTERWNQRHERT